MSSDKAYSLLLYDLMEYSLKYSENPGKLGKYLTESLRELIGGRTVLMFYYVPDTMELKILDVFPPRRKELASKKEIIELVGECSGYESVELLGRTSQNKVIVQLLEQLAVEMSIYIPLKVVEKHIGAILIHDLLSTEGNTGVIETLDKLSGVFALSAKNAMSFFHLEAIVDERTKELLLKNEELEKNRKILFEQNSEYYALNEEYKTQNEDLLAAKEEAEEYGKKFSNIYNNTPVMMHVVNMEGKIISVNDFWLKSFGYLRNQVLNTKSADYLTPASKEKFSTLIGRLINEGLVHNIEAQAIKRNGEVIDILASSQVELDKHGKPKQMFTYIIDVSERKKAERKQAELTSKLMVAKLKAEESDRLKSAFLANMSHEIRTPMNAILGFSSLLGRDNLSQEKKEFYIKTIEAGGNQLLSIISDIVDISKLESHQISLNMEDCSLNDLIDSIYSQFCFMPSKNDEVELISVKALSDLNCFIITDRARLVQVISNLIENALKFTTQGRVEFGYSITDDSLIKFYVKDTGIGIDPKDHKLIFERFRQVDDLYSKISSGTGLGLSISKGLVGLFGGEIWVESTFNEGACFYFTIPFLPENQNIVKRPPVRKEIIPEQKKITILLAEDEVANYLYMVEILDQLKYTILWARNGIEAIELFRNNPRINLILMDIRMPIMNGLEATKIIKKINPNLPILAQSAFAMKSDKEAAQKAGCNGYIVKPIGELELIKIIAEHVDCDLLNIGI